MRVSLTKRIYRTGISLLFGVTLFHPLAHSAPPAPNPLCHLYLTIQLPLNGRTRLEDSKVPKVLREKPGEISAEAYLDMLRGMLIFENPSLKDTEGDGRVDHSWRAFHHLVIFKDGEKSPVGVNPETPTALNGTLSWYLSLNQIRRFKEDLLDRVYRRYQAQGPERSEEIQRYRPEDVEHSNRTVNLIWIQEDPHSGKWTQDLIQKQVQPVSHFQIQLSSLPQDRLNTERHIQKDFARKPGEKWGDFGRLYLERFADLPQNSARLLKERGGGRSHVLEMLRTSVTWFLNEYKGHKAVFQVNSQMLTVLRTLLPKEALKNITEVKVGNHAESEWVVILGRKQLQQVETGLILRDLMAFLDEISAYHASLGMGFDLRYAFYQAARPFERESYRRAVGPLYQQSLDKSQSPNVDPHSSEFILYGFDHVNRLRELVQRALASH